MDREENSLENARQRNEDDQKDCNWCLNEALTWTSLGLPLSRSLNATVSQSELLLVKGQKESASDRGFPIMVATLVV